MNYEQVVQQAKKLSLFDITLLLHELRTCLRDESKISEARNKLSEGGLVEYYLDNQINLAIVEELHNSAVILREVKAPHRLFSLPYHALNIDSRKVEVASDDFAIGDQVYYICPHGHEHQGRIIRLNRKTVTIRDNSGGEIRVGYYYIRPALKDVS